MRHNVTFRSSFPLDQSAHPVGEELAKYIYSKLSEQNFVLSDFDNYGDFAWSANVSIEGSKPWILTGYVGDDDYEWLLQINTGVGFFKKLFGKSDEDKRNRIAEAVDGLLKNEQHFSVIRWHLGDFSQGDYSDKP